MNELLYPMLTGMFDAAETWEEEDAAEELEDEIRELEEDSE